MLLVQHWTLLVDDAVCGRSRLVTSPILMGRLSIDGSCGPASSCTQRQWRRNANTMSW